MKKLILASSLAIVMALAANAQTTGTLTITGELTGSMVLTVKTASEMGGPTLIGSGTSAAGLALGTFSASTPDGPLPSGVTKTGSDSTGFSLTSWVGINVAAANGSSSSYNLAANIDNTDQLTYSVAAVPMGTSPSQLTTGLNYGQDYPVQIDIRIPSTATTQTISRMITFTATAN